MQQTSKSRYSATFLFQLTPEEKQAIHARARSLGYWSTSAYCRDMLLHGFVNAPDLQPLFSVSSELAKLNVAVNRIGNNVNQIAHALNQGNYAPALLKEIRLMQTQQKQLFHLINSHVESFSQTTLDLFRKGGKRGHR